MYLIRRFRWNKATEAWQLIELIDFKMPRVKRQAQAEGKPTKHSAYNVNGNHDWDKYIEIARRFEHKALYQDRQDLRHKIVVRLAQTLSRVIPFASKEDDRPVLGCVRFAQKDGKLTLTSADGYRLAEVVLDFEDGEGEALISAKELAGLTSALKKAKRVRLSFEDSGERLDTKCLVIDTEVIRYKWVSTVGTYPDTGKLFPTEFIAEARFDTRAMLRASASLSALSLDKDTAIIIAINEGEVRLSVKDDKGEAQIEAQAEGEAQTAINGVYLRQALKALGGMAELKVNTPVSPMLLSVDGYRMVVMPVHIGIATKEAEAKSEAVAEDKPKRKHKAKEPVAVA